MSEQVLVVSGSVRAHSSTEQAATLALAAVQRQGLTATLVTLRDLALPQCDGSADQAETDAVLAWRGRVRSAHALVCVTPEWHASMAGPLKNALDHLQVQDTDGRAVAFVSQAGGHMPPRSSLDHLRAVGCSLHLWPTPTDVALARTELDAPGAALLARLDRMASELLRLVCLLNGVSI